MECLVQIIIEETNPLNVYIQFGIASHSFSYTFRTRTYSFYSLFFQVVYLVPNPLPPLFFSRISCTFFHAILIVCHTVLLVHPHLPNTIRLLFYKICIHELWEVGWISSWPAWYDSWLHIVGPLQKNLYTVSYIRNLMARNSGPIVTKHNTTSRVTSRLNATNYSTSKYDPCPQKMP